MYCTSYAHYPFPIEVKSRNSFSDSLILASHAMISVFFELSMAILEATSLCMFGGFFSFLGCCAAAGQAHQDSMTPRHHQQHGAPMPWIGDVQSRQQLPAASWNVGGKLNLEDYKYLKLNLEDCINIKYHDIYYIYAFVSHIDGTVIWKKCHSRYVTLTWVTTSTCWQVSVLDASEMH